MPVQRWPAFDGRSLDFEALEESRSPVGVEDLRPFRADMNTTKISISSYKLSLSIYIYIYLYIHIFFKICIYKQGFWESLGFRCWGFRVQGFWGFAGGGSGDS